MIDYPLTRAEAASRRYNAWAGSPKGTAYDPQRCAFEVHQLGSWLSKQCRSRPGSGPAALYCKQHGGMVDRRIADGTGDTDA